MLVPYRAYSTYLKFLGLTLFAYVVAAFTVHVDWRQAAIAAVVPHIQWDKGFILTLIAVFGVTISPYEFFWQSSEEVEEIVDEHKLVREESARPRTSKADVRFLDKDTTFGMVFLNVITLFVIITAAATLHAKGYASVQSAAQAAEVLKPLAGPLHFVDLRGRHRQLGAARHSGDGRLVRLCRWAAPFDWPRSLGKPFWQEWRFYGVIVGRAPSAYS